MAIVSFFTGCGHINSINNDHMSDIKTAEQMLEQIIGYLESGDAEGIKGLLSENLLSKGKENIDDQINEIVAAFSGKKVDSYTVRCVSSSESYREGKRTYYRIRPEAEKLMLDTGEEYSLRMDYLVVDVNPRKVGIYWVDLKINDDEHLYIGKSGI